MIVLENIYKTFGELKVLDGVDLYVEKNEVVTIIGSSGSGKSTLLRIINYLEVPTRGEIIIDGDIFFDSENKIKPSEKKINQIRAQKVGMVFQQFNLWPHKSVLENIIEAPIYVNKVSRKEAIEKAIDLLTKVGLEDKVRAYPRQLSGGQQQRVAIARALAMNPKVMLLDEVTSSLDPELIGEVLKVIEELASEGMTMIIVTHELNFAKQVSDRTMFLYNGKVWEQGKSSEVLMNPKREETKKFLAKFINGRF
ncbi:MAG: amino acid ABC transporter ATP-binding protein [Caldisericia bacterium]|nr:amino acid ABC transporter ATP-binding protein [Caldisericia bacterium]